MGHRHPNAIANLKRFPRGVSGNPKGGVKKGDKWTILQWQAHFKNAETTVGELDAIIKNRVNEPAHKVAASIQLRNCASTGLRHIVTKDGRIAVGTTDPEFGRERERLADRQSGKPRQEIHVTRHNEGPSLPDVIREAMAIAKQLGRVKVDAMIEGLQAKLADSERHALVDTTATVLTAAKSTAAAAVAGPQGEDWSDEGFNRAARAAVESMREPERPEPDPDAEALSKALDSV